MTTTAVTSSDLPMPPLVNCRTLMLLKQVHSPQIPTNNPLPLLPNCAMQALMTLSHRHLDVPAQPNRTMYDLLLHQEDRHPISSGSSSISSSTTPGSTIIGVVHVQISRRDGFHANPPDPPGLHSAAGVGVRFDAVNEIPHALVVHELFPPFPAVEKPVRQLEEREIVNGLEVRPVRGCGRRREGGEEVQGRVGEDGGGGVFLVGLELVGAGPSFDGGC